MSKKVGTLIKVFPIKRKINADLEYDSLLIWYRDEKGVKQVKYVDRAMVPYYIIKDKESQDAITPPIFIEREKVDKVMTYSDSLYREIASKTNSLAYYDRVSLNFGSKSRNMKNILKHPWIYDADMDIADRYIKNFHEEFEPDMNYKLHKVYFDIEVDLMEYGFTPNPTDKRKGFPKGKIGYVGFPSEDEAPCPVNIVTIIDSKSLVVYTYALKNSLNKSQEDFMNNGFEQKIAAIKETLKEEDNILVNDIVTKFFNTEEELIEAFFDTMHQIDPDIAMAWNQGYDVLTLTNRLAYLYGNKQDFKEQGIKGKDAMVRKVCDPKYCIIKNEKGEDVYFTPIAYYKQNKETEDFTSRMDEFTILDGIVWFDQMLLYANVRISEAKKDSYALDFIAEQELGIKKLDYDKYGYTIKNLAWKNYELFFRYNIQDVAVLFLLEEKNLDVDMVQRLSEVTNTRKYKVFKKTISIKNLIEKFAEEQGYIMNNNKNANYGDDSEYFKKNFLDIKPIVESDEKYKEAFAKKENFGAYVADPEMNLNTGIDLFGNGKLSKYIFEHVFDEDFSSLYPSIIRAFNLDKNAQAGKFFLLDDEIKSNLINNFGYDGLFTVSKNDEANASGEVSTSDIGPTLVDSLVSHDYNKIGKKYFNLPSTEDMIKELTAKKA